MAKFRELPGELVEEILCRVPAKSLKRLRCSCKQWNRLVKDAAFARKHSDKSAKQVTCLMLMNHLRISEMSMNLDGKPPSVEVKAELSLLDPRSSKSSLQVQFDVAEVRHCDGLLLCTSQDFKRIVVWNPFTGYTRWIEPGGERGGEFSLGYYQDKRSNTRRYKVLDSDIYDLLKSKIYDFDTGSWRIVDGGDSVTRPACSCNEQIVSFKGNTYWFASDEEKPELGVSLLRFDFETEKFGYLPLPYQSRYLTACFSVVGEEKLCVLLQQEIWSKTEIWVTDKIGESNKGVSWSRVLAFHLSLDLHVLSSASFLLDEEKKVVVWCDGCVDENGDRHTKDMIYIVGEDNNVTQVEFGVDEINGCWPSILTYFPSLAQIEPARGKKRKRSES